jgi:hypothetical protein
MIHNPCSFLVSERFDLEIVCLGAMQEYLYLICYGVFFGEILRYLRISSTLIYFENRAQMLVTMFIERGYKRSELGK